MESLTTGPELENSQGHEPKKDTAQPNASPDDNGKS